jgi:hypothetical protein
VPIIKSAGVLHSVSELKQGIKLSHERIYQMIWDDKRDGGNLWAQSSAARKTL